MNNKKEVFYFERGAFFGGSLTYRIEVSNNKYILIGYAHNGFCWMDNIEFEIPEKELDKLVQLLEPVLKWKEKYQIENDVLDGYGWSIRCKYKDTLIKTNGYEKYPSDYRKIIQSVQGFIEEVGKKYNAKYQIEGFEKRMKL